MTFLSAFLLSFVQSVFFPTEHLQLCSHCARSFFFSFFSKSSLSQHAHVCSCEVVSNVCFLLHVFSLALSALLASALKTEENTRSRCPSDGAEASAHLEAGNRFQLSRSNGEQLSCPRIQIHIHRQCDGQRSLTCQSLCNDPWPMAGVCDHSFDDEVVVCEGNTLTLAVGRMMVWTQPSDTVCYL